MKIVYEKVGDDEEEQIVVKCRQVTDGLRAIVRNINCCVEGVTAYRDGEIYKVKLGDVFWFEVVENKSFLYCEKDVYECKLRLYQFEELTRGTAFFRAGKSTVINSDKIESVSPTLSGRFNVKFVNGERGAVSRAYVSALKKVMGL